MAKMEAAATWEPIDSLTPWDKNPRRNDGAVEQVAHSITRFGFGAPIIARASDRVIIGGHTRYKAAQKLGLDKVPVRFLDLDPAEAAALALADNKLGELAEWDDAGVAAILAELEAHGAPIDGLGWDDEELKALLGDGLEAAPPSDDAPELDEHGEPDSQLGAVYQLGPHQLVCGSSLDESIIELCGIVDAVISDPPYGTGIKAKSGLGNSKVPMSIIGDETTDVAKSAVLKWSKSSNVQVWWGANYYSESLHGSKCWLIWDKDHHGMTYADAELAWTNLSSPTRVFRHAWSGMHRASERDTVRQHPTQKPIELYKWIFETLSIGNVVADPFGGSGTTLMACAQTGRIARLIELDPRYCDVIRKRWTRYADENGLDAGPGALRGEVRDGE